MVLASASPRRRNLLISAGFEVDVRVPNINETWSGGSLEEGVLDLARRKLDKIGTDLFAPVLAADTIVVIDDEILGKPADDQEAEQMLYSLSGREHQVITGFCVRQGLAEICSAVVTRVSFRHLSQVEILNYIASGEPFDKAGSYAIQGGGGAFVDQINGSYTNVVGLPLAEVMAAFQEVTR
ncbi:septum formation protein Maf [Myxococcota bacterium]|nr:septum formation protein Maf [Myxococcota bacterium]